MHRLSLNPFFVVTMLFSCNPLPPSHSPSLVSPRFGFPSTTAASSQTPPIPVSLILSARFTSGIRSPKQINCAAPLELIGELARTPRAASPATFPRESPLRDRSNAVCAGSHRKTSLRDPMSQTASFSKLRRRGWDGASGSRAQNAPD